MSSKRNIKFKCPYCDNRMTKEDLVIHINDKHEEMIPEGYTAFRLVFNYVNKKPMEYNGRCTECGGPTGWDENKGRYNRQCDKPSCKASYLRKFENNMMRTKGVTRISSTAEGQAKMLANRKISGTYKFQNGVEKTYTGSYELKALEFMDKVLNINPDDINCPGPILEYTYNDKKHLYITDFYYIPYNLIIEVKDGGKRPNKRDMPEYRGKQIAKEEYIIKNTDFNYLRLTDNDLSQLLAVFMDLKMQMVENNSDRVIHVNEDYLFESGKNDKKLYTISENNLDGKTLTPRIPENFLTKNGYEDNKTKRVCFSTSISKCLTALSQNCTNKEFFVHVPDPSKEYDIYKPTKDEVPDVIITDEHWILNPVNLICIGKIICTGDDGKDGKKYTYGDGKFAELYGWKYNWLEKYINESNDILSESLIKNNKYYRLTYNGIGIYEAFKNNCSYNEWKDFLNSNAAKWLPKPKTYEDKNNLNSYFTNIGYDMFIKNTYPVFVKKLNSELVKIDIYTNISGNVLYKDKYQIVVENSEILESTKSTLNKDYKPKGKKNLSSFKRVQITETVIDKYKKDYPFLKHVRCKDTNYYICDGYIWFDNNELVAIVGSCEYTDDKTKWIVSLEITKNYKGYGLSKQILDYATKTMNCKYLSVNKNNKIAKKVYDDYGFKVYQESDSMYYMTIDKNINESNDILLIESQIKNQPDIYYNKDKFDSGEINLCFITGHSGSGKSTMGRDMQKDNIEHYELDDLINNYAFSDENFKEYGDLIYSFFKGPGKKYRCKTYDDIEKYDNSGDDFYKSVNRSFINYAKKYAKSHKNTKFVIEGIWLYFYVNPEELKEYAVYIKGTSRLLSAFRASKRDSEVEKNKIKRFLNIIKGTIKRSRTFNSDTAEKSINCFRNYFNNLIKESTNEAMNALMTGYIPGVDSEGSVYVVNYMQNNVFSGEEERGYGISDNPKLTNLICRNKEGILTKAPSDLLEKCKYDVYMVNIDKDELSKKIYPYMEKFVSESFVYECIFGKKMYTYDQIMTEESAIPVIDYYKGLDLLGEMVHNFIMGKSNNDEYVVMNENSIMSLDYCPESKDVSCITYTSIVNGKYRVESVKYPELALESENLTGNNSVETKFIKLLTSFRRE